MDVVAINLGARLALLDTGETVPLTDLIDGDGNDVDEPSQAVGFVAGSGGLWFAGLLSDFETVATQ